MVSTPLVSSRTTMATIKVRRRANGSIRYTAIVRIRRGTTIVHRESRTFTHRSAAQSWTRHREVALEDPAEMTRQRQSTPTLAELIRWYIDTFETISRWQRSKQTHLEFLERHALGRTMAHTLAMRPPAGYLSVATRFMKSLSSRCMSLGMSSSAIRI